MARAISSLLIFLYIISGPLDVWFIKDIFKLIYWQIYGDEFYFLPLFTYLILAKMAFFAMSLRSWPAAR